MPAFAAADPAHSPGLHPRLPEPISMLLALESRWPPFAAGLPRLGGRAFGASSPTTLLPPVAPAHLLSARPPSCSSQECCTQSVMQGWWTPLAAGLLPALCRPLG